VGAKGSGRTRESFIQLEQDGAPLGTQTQETKEHLAMVRAQAGDRMFEVVRVNADGSKDELGTIQNSKTSTIGSTFGGGEYEIYEIERGTEMRTKRSPVKKILHPGTWPINPKYCKSARVMEQEFVHGLTPAFGSGAATSPLAGRSPEEILQLAKMQAKKEFEDEQRLRDLTAIQERTLRELEALRAAGGQVGGASNLVQMREMFGLMNEMRGPQMNAVVQPKGPIETLKEAAETLSVFKNLSGDLGFAGGTKQNPMLEKLAESLTQIGTTYAQTKLSPQGTRMLPPGPTGQARPSAQAPSQAAVAERNADVLVEDMQRELLTHLEQDQAAQLGGAPGSNMTQTATWLKSKWTEPYATQAWRSLKVNVVDVYPVDGIVTYMSGVAPYLVATPEKKAWLVQLLNMVKEK
jgi:hypothetical protein